MGHWYSMEGDPTYKVKGANGKMRDTTLRDARKLNLVPSVTTIMSVEDKPGLLVWKQAQLLKACIADPFDEETYDEEFWKRKVITESELIGKNAAEKGTIIHDALETHLKTGEYEDIKNFSYTLNEDGSLTYYDLSEFVEPVIKFMKERFEGADWVAEASFASRLGFGGKIDLHSRPTGGRRPIVLDYKTKDTDDRKKLVAYDQHHMQTAAYAKGLEEIGAFVLPGDGAYKKQISFNAEAVERYNLFISTHVPGMYELTESTDFDREFGMFEHLLKFWQLKNNYKPSLEGL